MTPARRNLLIGASVASVAAAGGFSFALLRRSSYREAEALKRARFVDFQGVARSLADWPGKILLVNFWATWCAPCLEEIPMLMGLRRSYLEKGFEVVGIAVDQAVKVTEMAAKLSIDYPVLLADAEGLKLLRDVGNPSGGLPYTLLLDRSLKPAGRKLGALKRPEAEAMLSRLMQG